MADKIMWPFGLADYKNPASAATLAVEVENNLTVLEPSILTGNMTLNVTVNSEIERGARLIVKQKATGTETLTFGTGIDAPVLVGVAGKTKVQSFIYDGTTLIAEGAPVQID